MVCVLLSEAVHAGNDGLGIQPKAEEGCLVWVFKNYYITSLSGLTLLVVAFLVKELYCVEPPPHPSRNDVEMS